MKKILLAALFSLVFSFTAPLFAQQISEGHESEYFYVIVSIEKIYPYSKGYVIQYRKGVNQTARTYLPVEWFSEAAGKGELVTLPPGKNWPYLTVYYKAGEFSHVRLYIHRSKTHETWGNIPLNVNIDDRFENIETIKLEL
ncbi:MAG: hypothetical protein LBK02_06995 [Treponema sp.]|jgi:hypothetical protein|nr:hypothetical protein [Treponema sp.]